MFNRNATEKLRDLARQFRVVGVIGPRQSGKSTLATLAFPDKPVVKLESPDVLEYAVRDPRGLLSTYREGAIIDEAQRAPELFSYLQGDVDDDRRPGRFILTGSQNFLLMERIAQSLAGRIAVMTLLPLAWDEIPEDRTAARSLDDVLFTGGYPEIWWRGSQPGDWHNSYIATYLERDVRNLKQVHDLGAFQRFMKLVAASVGQPVRASHLGMEAGVTGPTAQAWLSVLEASFVVTLLRPHFKNFRKRLVKTPKVYFTDVGLAARLLGIQDAAQLSVHPARGFLFENWVFAELLKARFNAGLDNNLWFWGVYSGDEVDLIVDQGQHLMSIECKSGATVQDAFFAGLRRWRALAGEAAGPSFVVYGGAEPQTRSDLEVIPWRRVGRLAGRVVA
ncbi:MAG: ATP-binding protein [Deltaproteobacteria bacterium]|nr:ATP-binding protein [Deltaproteobacteria bacterium]